MFSRDLCGSGSPVHVMHALILQDEAWRKEAVVLWSYADRLAAALDLRTPASRDPSSPVKPFLAGGVPNARPQSAAAATGSHRRAGHSPRAWGSLLVTSGDVSRDSAWHMGRRVATGTASCGRDGSARALRVSHVQRSVDLDAHRDVGGGEGMRGVAHARGAGGRAAAMPGPLDARSLGRVLRSINAVESYLCNTGSVLNLPEEALRDAASDAPDDAGAANVFTTGEAECMWWCKLPSMANSKSGAPWRCLYCLARGTVS